MLAFTPLDLSDLLGGECYCWRVPGWPDATKLVVRLNIQCRPVEIYEPDMGLWRPVCSGEPYDSAAWLCSNGEFCGPYKSKKDAVARLG